MPRRNFDLFALGQNAQKFERKLNLTNFPLNWQFFSWENLENFFSFLFLKFWPSFFLSFLSLSFLFFFFFSLCWQLRQLPAAACSCHSSCSLQLYGGAAIWATPPCAGAAAGSCCCLVQQQPAQQQLQLLLLVAATAAATCSSNSCS